MTFLRHFLRRAQHSPLQRAAQRPVNLTIQLSSLSQNKVGHEFNWTQIPSTSISTLASASSSLSRNGFSSSLYNKTFCVNPQRSYSTSPVGGFTYPAPRKLEDVAKLQLLEKHNADRVTEIWNEYHDGHKTAIADVLSQSAYDMLRARSKRCPLFVLPVPREGGYFALLLQFQERQILFTFLEDYKRNAQGAMPYLTITFFEEMLSKKNIALMRADVTNMMTRDEAKTIWDLLKMFYLSDGKIGYDAVVRFTEQPNQFDFNLVLRAAGIR